MSSHAMVSQRELSPDISKSVLKPGAVENGSQTLEHGIIPVAPKEGDENRPEIPTALRPTSPYRVGTDANADTNAYSMPKWNSNNHPGSIITGLTNEPDRFVDEASEGRQGCELPSPAKPSFCQEAQQADVGPHREDSFRALARDITAFSPYAARLGGRHSLDDDVADAAARLEGLRLEVQRDGGEDIDIRIDSMPSQAQEQRADKDYAPPPKAGIARKMEFYQENVHLDASPEMEVTVPQPKGVLTNTEKLEESPSCLVARVPTMLGRLQQEGDEPKDLPVVADRCTLVVNAAACLLHMGSEEFGDHQETPKRLELLCGEQGALRRTAFQGLEWADPSEVKPAVVTDLLRVHEYDYLLHIEERCKGAPSAIPPAGKHIEGDNNGGGGIYAASRNAAEITVLSKALPPGSLKTSSSRSGEFGDRFTPDASYVDVDTRVSRESYHAARMAAGAVITAVDRVVQGKNPNAFVAVRPPGHHAGPSGSSPAASFWKNPAMNSSGFCLLNNAAIGAAYARSRYGRTGEVSRVAIVDIDIHHGNGTEEIVRCLRPTTTRLPLPSSWPPMFKTVYKPWLDDRDADSVFFGSVSLQDKDSFYPASGTEQERFGDNDNIVNVSLTALGPTPGEETKKRALTKTKMTEYTNKARAELKAKCTRTLLARLKKFSPDLLIISAGFDGHVEDYYHYLSDDCYEWITLALEECVPSGRVVSVLEGGYSLQPRVSKSKATQARANAKRTSKPEPSSGAAAAEAFGSGGVVAISSSSCRHPALRERRSRPATRGMNASSSSAPRIPSAAAAAAMTASIKNRPVPPLPPPPISDTFPTASLGAVAPALSDLEAPASTYDAVSRSHADRISFGVGGSSTGTYVSGGGAAFSALETPPAGFESVGFVAEAGVSLTRVPGEKTRDHLGVAPIVLADPPASAPSSACNDVIGKHLSVRGGNPSSKVGMLTGARGIASQVEEEKELPLVRPEDGGLVRGVVSHVNALVVASGRRGNGVGEAFSTVETPRKQACF